MNIKAFKIILISFTLIISVSHHCKAQADFVVDGIYYRMLSIEELTCVVSWPKVDNKPYSVYPEQYNQSFCFRSKMTDDIGNNIMGIVKELIGERYSSGEVIWEMEGFKHYQGVVNIPETVQYKNRDIKVVGIDNRAFYLCKKLTQVSIPSTVSVIGDYAFFGCIALERIIGDIRASLGKYAFAGCISLPSISLTGGEYISVGAFMYCTALRELSIPKTIKNIGGGALADCPILKKITFEDGHSTLNLHNEILYDYELGRDLRLHGKKTDPLSLDYLYIGRSLRYVSEYFAHPFEAVVKIVLGDSVESIKTGYTWEGRIIERSTSKFGNPFDLKSLKKIVIGKGLKEIEPFIDAKLESIVFNSEQPPLTTGSFSMYNKLNATLYVPRGALNNYKNSQHWREFVIKEN